MRLRDRVAMSGCIAAVAVAVFVVGGAFRWTQAITALVVAITLCAHLTSRRDATRPSALLVTLGVAATLCLISLLPLPSAIRAALDPIGNALREDGNGLIDASPWPALTHDVPGSLRGLVFFLTLIGVAVIASRLAVSERGRFQVQAIVAAVCGGVAIVTAIHELVGASRLYGVYDMHARPNILGPLLNENHLGCLSAIGACISAGLLMYRHQRSTTRAVWLLCVLGCSALAAASNSRGALIGLGAGGLVFVGLLLGQRYTGAADARRRRPWLKTNTLPIVIVAACGVVLVIYMSAGSVSEKLGKTTVADTTQPRSKFMAWRSAEDLIRESPWVGVGRGGLETTFTRVHAPSGQVIFAYLENEYIETVVDWGIPGALVIAGCLLWICSVALRRWRDGPLTAGAIASLAALAIQSNVDYGLELLGVAVPAVVVAATLTYVPIRELKGRQLVVSRGLRAVLAGLLVVGAIALFSDCTMTVAEDHNRVLQLRSEQAVRDDLHRHPLDYFAYAFAATHSSRPNDPQSIRLLSHAMRLHPTHPDLHRTAAKLLLQAGHPEQAAIEYAAAFRGSGRPDRMLAEITSALSPQIAATAIPDEYPNLELITNTLRELKHEDVATLWLQRILVTSPRDVHACTLLYDLALQQRDLAAAETAGRYCVELLPDHQTRLALASVLLQRQHYNEVVTLLQDVEQWTGMLDQKGNAWLTLCDARIGLERWDEASSCLRHLDASGDLGADRQSELLRRFELVQDKRRITTGSGSP